MDFEELVPSFADISSNNTKRIPQLLNFITEHLIKRLKSKSKQVHNLAFYFMTKLDEPEPLLSYLDTLEKFKSN